MDEGDYDEEEQQISSVIEAELDPNHTHFVLVDDGSNNIYGKEIEFRANLENELRKGKSDIYYENYRLSKRPRQVSDDQRSAFEAIYESDANDEDSDGNVNEELKSGLKKDVIPMVLIVVQGGPNSLKTVAKAIEQNVPILVLAVSCASFVFIFAINGGGR